MTIKHPRLEGLTNLENILAQVAASSPAKIHSPPKLTIEEGLDWKLGRKSGLRKTLPHAELLTDLENRDHVSDVLITRPIV